MKGISRRKRIIEMFTHPMAKLTCKQVTDIIIVEDKLKDNKARYLSGSISSILNKLVKDNVLAYHDIKTNRGGHIYKLNTE